VTLHLALAGRVLDEWRTRPDPPIPTGDPALVNAFRAGALGPDMGYFPGGPRFLSDLAHCVGSGRLTRALLEGARTPRERAFAWGWVTHVLADRFLHPVIGQGVSAFLGEAPLRSVSAECAPEAHVRVEGGVDVWISGLAPELRSLRLEPVFDALSVQVLRSAFQRTYGIEVGADVLLAGHHGATRLGTAALATMGHLSTVTGIGEGHGLVGSASRGVARLFAGVAGFATDRLGAGGMALALLTPAPPPGWLRLAVAEEVRRFPDRVREVERDSRSALPDVNLDTGAPDGTDPEHETTRRTLGALEGRRASALGLRVLPLDPLRHGE